jgi:hypothetical protein
MTRSFIAPARAADAAGDDRLEMRAELFGRRMTVIDG